MTATRVMIAAHGGPGAMTLDSVDLPAPGPGEVQIAQTAIGLNYMDVYQRNGSYPLALPSPLGLEAAGEVVALGDGVEEFRVGDRVVYAGVLGAYATHRNAPAARCLPIPSDVTDEQAAAVLLKGLTVEYLLTRTYKVRPQEDVLFWAASGGVGQLAGQWGKALGARMIGVTSGAKACDDIRALGYAEAIDRSTEDVAKRVAELTGGRGVSVAYDSVGKASFDATLNSLATFGYFVSFGATTGPAPDVPPAALQMKGSLFFTRPTLAHYMAARSDLLEAAQTVFGMMAQGALTVNINQRFALTDIVQAHEALESGQTTGSSIILPAG